MFYKETKQLAAHRLLALLQKECRVYTKYGGQPMYKPSYLWTNLQQLNKKIKWYNIATLRDAAWELKDNDEIDILNNLNNIYDIQLGILPKGLTDYKERTHISNFLKSWKNNYYFSNSTIGSNIDNNKSNKMAIGITITNATDKKRNNISADNSNIKYIKLFICSLNDIENG